MQGMSPLPVMMRMSVGRLPRGRPARSRSSTSIFRFAFAGRYRSPRLFRYCSSSFMILTGSLLRSPASVKRSGLPYVTVTDARSGAAAKANAGRRVAASRRACMGGLRVYAYPSMRRERHGSVADGPLFNLCQFLGGFLGREGHEALAPVLQFRDDALAFGRQHEAQVFPRDGIERLAGRAPDIDVKVRGEGGSAAAHGLVFAARCRDACARRQGDEPHAVRHAALIDGPREADSVAVPGQRLQPVGIVRERFVVARDGA